MKMLKPLRWPEGWNRAKDYETATPVLDAPSVVVKILTEMAAKNIVLTANVEFVSDDEALVDDPGVAVYFSIADRPYVIANDRYIWPSSNVYEIYGILKDLEHLLVFSEAIQDRALQGFTELPPEKAGIAWPLHWMRIMGSLPDWNRMMPETQRRWIDQRYAEMLLTVTSEQAFRDLRQARVEAFADVGAYVMGEKE